MSGNDENSNQKAASSTKCICPDASDIQREFSSMRNRLLRSKAELLKIKADHNTCQLHVRRLMRQVQFLDELNDVPVYCGLRELEGKVLKIIQIVEDVKAEFASMTYTPFQRYVT